jgi:hypothetical protein
VSGGRARGAEGIQGKQEREKKNYTFLHTHKIVHVCIGTKELNRAGDIDQWLSTAQCARGPGFDPHH